MAAITLAPIPPVRPATPPLLRASLSDPSDRRGSQASTLSAYATSAMGEPLALLPYSDGPIGLARPRFARLARAWGALKAALHLPTRNVWKKL